MRALMVKHGILGEVEIKDTDTGCADDIHALIGNWFTSCFHVPGVGPHMSIIGYCDDEGLYQETPDWNVVPDSTLRLDHQPIVGPIVITGLDERTGETRELLDVEMEMFRVSKVRHPMQFKFMMSPVAIPMLTFRRLDDLFDY